MSKPPTVAQRKRWEEVREMGCLICSSPAQIHHLYTGAGGRKNHDRVAPLCYWHHIGPNGIDGRQRYSKKTWQEAFITEREMEKRVQAYLQELQ